MDELGREVGATNVRVGAIEEEVTEQGERLDDLEETVDETVEKVQEIDRKVGVNNIITIFYYNYS